MIERERTNRHGRRRERDECICVLKQTFDQSADCCQSYVATAYPSVPVARPRIQFCVFTRRGNQRSRSFVAAVRVHSRRNLAKNTYTPCTYNTSLKTVHVQSGCSTWSSLLVFPVPASVVGGRWSVVVVVVVVGVEYVWPESSEPALSRLAATNVGDDDGRKMVERGGGDPWWRRGPFTAERHGNVWWPWQHETNTVCVRWLRTCVCFLRKMSALPVAFDD